MGIVIRKSFKPIPLGTDADGKDLELSPRWLRTHLHLIGPTGTGKSRLLLWLFQLLCATGRPIVLVDFKGGLYRMARDWTLSHGKTSRVVLFDLSAEMLPGYNPLRESGLRTDLQAQWASEGIKSAWGQATFDETPQLARMLYLCLYVSRALTLSLVEGLNILRPASTLRQHALARIADPFVHGALLAFDQLNDRRQEELAASTLARLEAFCRDEIVRKVICSPRSLDLETLLSERKIILINFAKYQPLLPEPMKLLARLFTSDLLAHIYKGHGEGRFDEHRPVYFLCDEVQNMATRQLCDALDEGRGIGLHCILAHQHLAQLALEDQSGYLLQSVMTDARTKIIFGDLPYDDLEVLAKNVMIDRYSPWPTKDQLGKTARLVTTESKNHSKGRGMAWPVALSGGITIGNNNGTNRSTTHGTQESTSEAHTRGTSRSRSLTYGYGRATTSGSAHTEGTGYSETSDASRDNIIPDSMSRRLTEIASESTADTLSESYTDSSSFSETETTGENEASTYGRTHGTSVADTEGDSRSTSFGLNLGLTAGVTPSESEEWGDGVSTSIQPLSPDEQTLLAIQAMKAIPKAHFLLKAPETPACIIQAPWVEEPRITRNTLQSGMERVYALPFYTHRDAPVTDGEAHGLPTPQQTIAPQLPDGQHPLPAGDTPPVGPRTFRRKRNQREA